MRNLEIINLLRDVACGVPQWTIPGTLSFKTYVNYICNVSEKLNVVSYADDTSFYTTHNDIDILFNRTNMEL